ncbi:MAG: chemotaxis protein CheA, partial [Clostridiales bacterium]|nr:chemotaxis protein CheA [Clostridiales bacterium]
LDNFDKAARQLNKITNELQDIVMSIRMVPLSATFNKMKRIVRDMSKSLDKEVTLNITGEETEVDKNIIEHISDPLMHLVRNALDHGLESAEDRVKAGKEPVGNISLEAKNVGSDVLIIVRDDGKGIKKESIIAKAREKGLLKRPPETMSDKEIYNLILLPGFSTNENVTEYSGRGVGMDVVAKGIEAIGGFVYIDSIENAGTAITMKIPLTLAIVDGMNVRVGGSIYTIPTINIREFFEPNLKDIITDPDKNEMVMVRGECFPILRLHKAYNVETEVTNFEDGIFIIVQHDKDAICVFVDKLIGQQQIVVKSLPEYIKRRKNIKGLAGCTLLGDGSISLILDVAGLDDLL